MKRIHIVNPYGSTAMQRMINPLLEELSKLYEITTSQEVDHAADVNIHAPWHTLVGMERQGEGKHIAMYTHCNPPDAINLHDACERADLIVCMSYAGRNELLDLGVDPKKLWVIYAAADVFMFRKRLLAVVGYPQPNGRKRESILLDLAWKYDMSTFQIVLIGNGWEEMTAKLSALGISVVNLATVNDDKLHELYGRMDCLLVTGYAEGGPLPLLEALASGVKVFSPNFGYAADLLPDENIYDTVEELGAMLDNLVGKDVFYHKLARAWGWLDYAAEYALLIGRLLGETVDLYPERGMSRYTQLLDEIEKVKPRSICEIGTWNGNRALQMIQTAAKYRQTQQINYQGFDLFKSMTGEQFRREFSKAGWEVEIVQRRLDATGANIELIEGDTNTTLNTNLKMHTDFIFVDGGHSEETIKHDTVTALDILNYSPDAVLVFDDYYHVGKPEGVGCNVSINRLNTDEFEIEHLPARTFTDDGREIGMVKVQRHANLHIQRRTTQTGGVPFDDTKSYNFMPSMRTVDAPRPSDSDGELERLTSQSGE